MRKKKIDKKVVAILTLVIVSVVAGIGWFRAETKPAQVLPFPETVENRTTIFHGYEAYLDRRVSLSVVLGPSMEPTFGENDVILWVEVDNMAELQVGDIIIFQHPTRPYIDNIVHRIVEVGMQNGGYTFRTAGDNSGPDQHWVPEEKVHGLIIGVIYSAGP